MRLPLMLREEFQVTGDLNAALNLPSITVHQVSQWKSGGFVLKR